MSDQLRRAQARAQIKMPELTVLVGSPSDRTRQALPNQIVRQRH